MFNAYAASVARKRKNRRSRSDRRGLSLALRLDFDFDEPFGTSFRDCSDESERLSEVVERFDWSSLGLTVRGSACVEEVREVGGAGAEGFLRVTTMLAGRR